MPRVEYTQAAILGASVGFVLAIAMILWVAATGQTFGQRCAKVYESGSSEWRQCIDRLRRGGVE